MDCKHDFGWCDVGISCRKCGLGKASIVAMDKQAIIDQLQVDKAELVKAGNRLAAKWVMCLDLGAGPSMDSGEFDIHVNTFKTLLAKHSTSTSGGEG